MLKIDAHQHFWVYKQEMDGWINDDMQVLRRDYLPADLDPLLNQYAINSCIAVQADQSAEENSFLLQHAEENEFIKGVVGWVDLQSPDISEQLQELHKNKKLKGFRHVLQGEADRAFMLKPDFLNGISKLKDQGFTYDILIHADQLRYVPELVNMFPDQAFVLDHIAKPDIKSNKIADWATGIKALSGLENLKCKISGMVTEANWDDWREADFSPYLDVVFEAFGAKRIMFGSDWPVCLLAGNYGRVLSIMENYISKLTENEQRLFWSGNAIQFYNLN